MVRKRIQDEELVVFAQWNFRCQPGGRYNLWKDAILSLTNDGKFRSHKDRLYATYTLVNSDNSPSRNSWGTIAELRDYISQDAPRINAGTLFPRIPWASIQPEIFLRGLETSGPRWRRERAVSICLAFAWKVFVEPRPGNRFVTLSGSRSNDLPESPEPSEIWARAALLRPAVGG